MSLQNEKRVLVFDGDEALRAAALAVLPMAGVEVDFARASGDAVQKLARHTYAAVLIDVDHETGAAWDLLRMIGRRDLRPVVVVAANDARAERFDPRVVSLIVRKPYDLQTVVGVLLACGTSSTLTSPRAAAKPAPRSAEESRDRSAADGS